MSDALELVALADLVLHPDSSARTIARRIGVSDDRLVFAVLARAAYEGKVQRWKEYAAGGPWLWQIPGTGQ
jgi:hypothetical protein